MGRAQTSTPFNQPNWNWRSVNPQDPRYLADTDREDTDLACHMSVDTDDWEDGVKSLTYTAHCDVRIRIAHVLTTKSDLRDSLENAFADLAQVEGVFRPTSGISEPIVQQLD